MYAKVFTSLWQGTLCGQSDAQLVFIYLLAHADEEGSVTAAPQAIGALTGIGLERTMTALQILEGPDPHSTSPALDGRRLERIGNGWTWAITNYAKYKDIRRKADRMEQNRQAKQRQRASAFVSNGQQPSAMSAHAEVDTDAEVNALETNILGQKVAAKGNHTGKELRREWLEMFDQHFWPAYPRKVAKEAARKAWGKLFPIGKGFEDLEFLAGDIMDGLSHHQRTQWDGRDADKIPHASTWLNQRRFTDASEA